jgi:hypothetical protein
MNKFNMFFTLSLILAGPTSLAGTFEKDKETILKQAGCYLVDYSFVETESLKPGYERDRRVYDANTVHSTYELIIPVQKSEREIRLQHVLFVRDQVTGNVTFILKHQAEDWAYGQEFRYDFVSRGLWRAVEIDEHQHQWTRKVTNLDDGLRYQCSSKWDHSKANPEWSCSNFAPIPGRETRDMKRSDYNTLDRSTRLIVYQDSWLERQNNIKTIQDESDKRVALARELGRTWYIKQPTSLCQEAQTFASQRSKFWEINMSVWDEILGARQEFSELAVVNVKTRYQLLSALEDESIQSLAHSNEQSELIKSKIKGIIEQFRKR